MSQLSERQKKLVSIVIRWQEKQIPMTKLQKIVFLCEEQIKSCDIDYTFTKSHYGPFSKELVSDIDDLQQKGIVKVENGNKVFIVEAKVPDIWIEAEKTVLELGKKFPTDYAIMKSALTAPNVISRDVGEQIKTSH